MTTYAASSKPDEGAQLMSHYVIAEFHAAKGKLADLTAALGGALV